MPHKTNRKMTMLRYRCHRRTADRGPQLRRVLALLLTGSPDPTRSGVLSNRPSPTSIGKPAQRRRGKKRLSASVDETTSARRLDGKCLVALNFTYPFRFRPCCLPKICQSRDFLHQVVKVSLARWHLARQQSPENRSRHGSV